MIKLEIGLLPLINENLYSIFRGLKNPLSNSFHNVKRDQTS